ncbi:MAG TPA: PHP domain-containing protein [Burkholderiales bacterium]|nr:PHP domain-containing protein [Burkholderiales bacterium]
MRISDFDLHTHSTYSDGLLTPAELVARAAHRGVKTLALTDHDELGGLDEARCAAQAHGVKFIDGVEISVTWQGHTLHVVGLLIDPAHSALMAELAAIRAGRRERAQRIADALAAAGVPDALAGARAHARNPELVGRTHFARYLVQRGLERDVGSVFKRYLTNGKPGYVRHQWASLQRAIECITVAGGIAVLAHPGRYKLTERERDCMLDEFKSCGGRAIEVVTGSHASQAFEYWGARARRHGVLASLGSDFHGPGESYRDVGELPPLPSRCDSITEHLHP